MNTPATIGAYPVVHELGAGAFGTVYLAQHPTTGTAVAIKVFNQLQATDRVIRAQLHQEISALLAVRSPYCLQVIDVIDTPELLGFVTEYIKGVTLRALLDERGRLDPPTALNVLWGAANGLAAVHASGLVHGDVKPANILVDEVGSSRIIDFGLASAPGRLRGDELAPYGSPAYASPEQLQHGYRDARSDIYALSVTLFELLTGQRPYTQKTIQEVAAAHINQPVPDPRELVPDLGDDLTSLIMHGMSKDPAQRPQDMTRFLAWFHHAATARYGDGWKTAGLLATVVTGLVGTGALASGVIVASSSTTAAAGAGVAAAGAATAAGASSATSAAAITTGGIISAKVAVIAVGTVIAVGAATGGVIYATNGDSTSPATVPDYTSQPTTTWTKSFDSLVPGYRIDNNYIPVDGPGTSPVTSLPGVVVVGLTSRAADDWENASSGNLTVGLDPSTGAVKWKHQGWCTTVDDSTLLCVNSLVNAGSGADEAQLQIPSGTARSEAQPTAADSSGVYITWAPTNQTQPTDQYGNKTGYNQAVLAKFSRSGGAPLWTENLTTTDPTQYDSQSYPLPVMSGGAIAVSWASNAWLYTSAGDLLNEATGGSTQSAAYRGGAYKVIQNYDAQTTTVTRVNDGSTRLSTSGMTWNEADAKNSTMWTTPSPDPAQLGIGDSYYTVAGRQLWSRSDLTDRSGTTPVYPNMTISSDRTLVTASHPSYAGSSNYTTDILDARDGTTLWNAGTSVDPRFIGNAAVDLSDTSFSIRNARSGVLGWSRTLSQPNNDVNYPDVIGGAGVIALVEGTGLTVYTGFATTAAPANAPTRATATSDQTPSAGSTSYVTACGSEPTFTPVSANVDSGDQVSEVVTYKITATCPGGQWLTASQYSVPFVADGTTYLDGYFNFTQSPAWVTDAGTTVSLRYPPSYMRASNAEVQDAMSGNKTITVPCKKGPNSTNGTPATSSPTAVPTQEPQSATTQAPQTAAQANTSALETLRRWVRHDAATLATLKGKWIPQLSSKKIGTPSNYTSWEQVLENHLSYRQRYPGEALLLWSNDWPGTYGPSSQGFFVTVRGVAYNTADKVLDWCRQEAWQRGDCFAKRVAKTGDPRNNLKMMPTN